MKKPPAPASPSAPNATPMIRQYLEIKARYADAILFYRMGDFYEMFFEDALVGSRILDITLTSRDKDSKEAIPFCGVPHHSADFYIAKLVENGYRVAICEQVEDPRTAKGLVRREVVRVVTPGLVVGSEQLEAARNNYLAAALIHAGGAQPAVYGLAYLDLSTGDFGSTERSTIWDLEAELARLKPREMLVPENAAEAVSEGGGWAEEKDILLVTRLGPEAFTAERAMQAVVEAARGDAAGLDWIAGRPAAVRAAGAILAYLGRTQSEVPSHLAPLRFDPPAETMVLDSNARRTLEIEESMPDRTRKGSLLDLVDRTKTPMGARLLRRWLGSPLVDPGAIAERLDAVEVLKGSPSVRGDAREILSRVQDLERLCGKVTTGRATPRDLAALRRSLEALLPLSDALAGVSSELLDSVRARLDPLPETTAEIAATIVDDPALGAKEVGIIRPEASDELRELLSIARGGKEWLAVLEAEERRRSGIPTLRVGYNRVFGYYIEVTRSYLGSVPGDYERRQTLTGAERFVTPGLKEMEARILGAEERIEALERALFAALCQSVARVASRIRRSAEAVAQVDALACFAEVAEAYRYTRPEVDSSDTIEIQDGRHPVVERTLSGDRFVPNDALLGREADQILIITGPNMAGKSTYLRQVALIVILAQAGSFVPAARARIGVVDRIFTRVGASDRLASGMSTFMVEMVETATILEEATARSLILLDEVGRGTSTFDGLSIAWAIAEHLHSGTDTRPRTLFATHYHELTELSLTCDRVRNYNVLVKEWGEEVLFLRRIVEGSASRSYGIQVARLAGLPEPVLKRAKEVLANLERGEVSPEGPRPARSPRKAGKPGGGMAQLDLFQDPVDTIRESLRSMHVESLTPLEAMKLLDELARKAKEEA